MAPAKETAKGQWAMAQQTYERLNAAVHQKDTQAQTFQ